MAAKKYPVAFTKSTRRAVAKTSDGLPTLSDWLTRIANLDVPALDVAIGGIWCGRSGRETIDLPGSNSMLCVGWENGKVEWAYIS